MEFNSIYVNIHNILPSSSLSYIKVYTFVFEQIFCSSISIMTKLNRCLYNPIIIYYYYLWLFIQDSHFNVWNTAINMGPVLWSWFYLKHPFALRKLRVGIEPTKMSFETRHLSPLGQTTAKRNSMVKIKYAFLNIIKRIPIVSNLSFLRNS